MSIFQRKLKHLKGEIKSWNNSVFGNIFKAKENLNQDMKSIQQRMIAEGRSEELAQKEQSIENQILERDLQEETLWRQKSRVRWLKEGEKNIKLFHKTTVQRRMSNQISHINNEQGSKIETHEVTEDHNLLLLKPISLQEVENVVHQLKTGKAPGPDGFTSNFFQHFWDLVKWEVWQVVEESRTLRWMYPGMNTTFTALIPKVEESNTPDKYRPIALCNIIYKIVSKVIASRLKPLLPLIISPEQSRYVEGRQITNGIILTHEIIHSLKQ
eukprot:PITA_12568